MNTQLYNTIQNPTIEVTMTATQEIGRGLREFKPSSNVTGQSILIK
jgi:hypothetical protein